MYRRSRHRAEPGGSDHGPQSRVRARPRAAGARRSTATAVCAMPCGGCRRRAAAQSRRRKVMAVSSGGGHWVELRRIRAAFAGLEVVYVSTDPSAAAESRRPPLHDPQRHPARPVRLSRRARGSSCRILLRERPDVVVTTGAAPGFVALARGQAPAALPHDLDRFHRERRDAVAVGAARAAGGRRLAGAMGASRARPRGRSTGAPCCEPRVGEPRRRRRAGWTSPVRFPTRMRLNAAFLSACRAAVGCHVHSRERRSEFLVPDRVMDKIKPRKIMAIASGGGHWVQMRRIMPAFEGLEVFYVSVDPSSAADVPGRTYYTDPRRQPPRPARLRGADRPARAHPRPRAARRGDHHRLGALPRSRSASPRRCCAPGRSGSIRSPTPSGCPPRAPRRGGWPTSG